MEKQAICFCIFPGFLDGNSMPKPSVLLCTTRVARSTSAVANILPTLCMQYAVPVDESEHLGLGLPPRCDI